MGLSLLVLFAFSISYFGEDRIRLMVESAGIWALVLIIALKALTIIIPPLSGVPLYLMAGSLFGVTNGLAFILIGDALGYSTAFFLSRYLGRQRLEKFMFKNETGTINKIVTRLSTVKGFIVVSCVFSFASELVAYAAGLSRLPFKYFLPIFMIGDGIVSFILIWTSDRVGISLSLIAILMISLVAFSAVSFLISNWYDKRKRVGGVA
ncbi:MAG: hypothetical protein RJB39_652 [Candidatus Parcubacteria bacterium]